MDKNKFLSIINTLYTDDTTALDYNLSDQFNAALRKGVEQKWITSDQQFKFSKGLNQKRVELYGRPVEGPDGLPVTKNFTRVDGTSVTRPMTFVDLLEARKSPDGGSFNGYVLPANSLVQLKGVASREEIAKQSAPASAANIGKRDTFIQEAKAGQLAAQQEEEKLGVSSNNALRDFQLGVGGVLGAVRGVGAPIESLIRKGMGQSREEMLQQQFGRGGADLNNPLAFGGDEAKYIGQQAIQSALPTLAGLAGTAAGGVVGGALGLGLPGAIAGGIGGAMLAGGGARTAQDALVNAVMGTRYITGPDGKKKPLSFVDEAAGLQKEISQISPYSEAVAELIPNLIGGSPKVPTFLNPKALMQGAKAGFAGSRALLAAENVAVGQGTGLAQRGYAAALAKMPKLAAANQAIATSKVGRSIKGWNAGINQLAATEGAVGQEVGEEFGEFTTEIAQGLYDRQSLIRENENRRAQNKEEVEVPGYFELIRDAVLGASFEGENRLQSKAFKLGGAIGNAGLQGLDVLSRKTTGQSLNPYVTSVASSATTVAPITAATGTVTGVPATPDAHPVSAAEAADMFRGFTAASGERVIPISNGQFAVVDAEGRVSRVVEASEIDPTVFTPRGSVGGASTTQAHVDGAGTLLSRSGIRGAEFKPIGAEKETVLGTTPDGYAIRRTVVDNKIDVRVVSPDVLQPENQAIAKAHFDASGITPTDKTGFTAADSYAQENTLGRAMLGDGTPAAQSFDAAFDTDIAIDSGFTVRGRVVGKAKFRGREVNTHYVVQVPSGNGQTDTIVVPAQNIITGEGKSLKIHPVMDASQTHNVLKYSQLTADDVTHEPHKVNTGKISDLALGDGISPVMLTSEQTETARAGREAIATNAETMRTSGRDLTTINRSTAQRQGRLRSNVRASVVGSDTAYNRGDYIEHTDFKGETVAGVVVNNSPHGPVIAPLDGSPTYIAQPSTITYTQGDTGATGPATPTPEEAAAAAIAETMPEDTGGGSKEDREAVIQQKITDMTNDERQTVWRKMIAHILATVNEADAGKADFDAAEMGAAIGVDPDVVEGIMGLAELTTGSDGNPVVKVSPTGAYDFTSIFRRQKEIVAAKAAKDAAAAGTAPTPDAGTPELEGEFLEDLPSTLSEDAAEAGPQEGGATRRSAGEEEARKARETEDQEEYTLVQSLKDVTISEGESEAVAEFSAAIGGAWHEIQALKPRNVEELEAALVKFLTGAQRGDGTTLSTEDAKKPARLLAELYDRMIFAQANRQLQMAQDVLEGRTDTPSSRTTRTGSRILTEHSGPDVETIAAIASDIEDEALAISGGTKSWQDLGNDRTDKELQQRIMRKLRMQIMRKYYADNVPVIGVLDSVDALNESFNAIFAKGVVAGQPSIQVLLGFADRDVSSAVHEIAHALLENMPEAMQKDILASLGFTPRTPTPSNPSIISREAHEKWATTFEAQILNAGSTNKRGKVVKISSDRTVGQEGQMSDINDILEGLSPYLQDVYNVVYDNTGPRRARSLVWQLDYQGQEERLFLWDNMPLVIEHEGAQVLAKIPLAPMPQRLFRYTGPGLLPKGSPKQFEVEITQEGHPDFGKTFTITNGSILSIGGATNGFNTRLATSFAYWLSAINGGRSRDYKGLGKYERFGRDEPGYEPVSDTDKAALASMGESADAIGTSVPPAFLELKASDPEVKKLLTELGLDDLTQADLNEIKALGLREDAEYWAKRYSKETGDWKERLADSIIDLRGLAIARKLLQGRGAVAEGYLRLQNGRYHPKLVEFAEAVADVIRTSRYNIRAAEKANAEGQLVNVNNFELINSDLATGQVIMKGPKSDPKTYRVNLNTGDVFLAQGLVQDGPNKGQIQWRQIQIPALPAGFKKWTSLDTKAEVGQAGVMATNRMNGLANEMGAKTPPQPVNYYYQIARIKVSLDKNVVVAHPPTVFYQQSGGRALNEATGMPLAQASQKKRNKSVGKPIADVGLLDITPEVVDAIQNQKHNEHVMRRIDTSQIYNVRPSDLPNSHAERSALIINRETERILAAKDDVLKSLRQAEYARSGRGAVLKPYVYRVFDTASYIDPETNAPALKYERTPDGEIVTDEDGNRVPLLDEAGEPVLDKKYVERFVVSYGRITPKTDNAILDMSKEELIKGDGSSITEKMSGTERAFKMAGRIVFYDPIDVQTDGSSSVKAVDLAVNHMVSEFNGLALRAMEKYTPIVNWNRAESGMQVWAPMTPVMKVEVKRVSGVDVLLPSLGAPKQAYNFDAVGATNRWNASGVTRLPKDIDKTLESLIDAVDSNDKHYFMVTNEGGKYKYSIGVTNVETKAISIVEGDTTYGSEKDAVDAAQKEYEALRGQAYLVWHQTGAKRVADDILRIAELSQKSEKGLTDEEIAEVHNAKVIMRQYDWYRGVSREIMKRYGKAGIMMADLVGATSPQTPVDSNWVNAGQILQNMMRPVYERIVRDTGGAKVAYRLPFSSERSITVYGLWRQLSFEANKMRDSLQVREKKPLVWDSKFVKNGRPDVAAIQNASDAELTSFLGSIAPKLETKIQDSSKRRQLESVVQSFIESVYWKRDQGGSDPVASFVGWSDKTQDWIPVSGMKYEVINRETVTTPIENEYMPLQRIVVPRNAVSGAKFGANTDNVMQALYNSWLDIDEGVAAKARNFSLNLVALSSGATIDVWAARYIRRAFHDWHQGTPGYDKLSDAEKAFFARIPPIAEAGVEGGYTATGKEISYRDGVLTVEPPKYSIPNPADPRTSGEFGTGQAVMQMATDMINKATGGKLDMLPSDLQAVLWFTEKEVWSNAGWTNSSGAGGSFEYQMMQDIIRFGGFDRWTAQLSGNGVAHLTPVQREVTLKLLNRMVYKGYGGDTIPVGYSSFLLSHTSGDQLSIDGRAQLDGMVIGYKGNNPLQPYNPETDLHLVVLNQPEKSLLSAINGVGNSSIVVTDPDLGAYVGKRIAIAVPNEKGASILASVVPDEFIQNSNGTYTVVLRASNQLTDSTAVVLPKPVQVDAKKISLNQSQNGEYSTALLGENSLAKSHINGKAVTALFPARQATGKHRGLAPVAPFDPLRIYESVARYIQMSGSLDGVVSKNIGDLNVDINFDARSNARAGFEWSFAPALSNQRIVGDPKQVRYYQQFSELINRLQSHFRDNGEHLQMVVQNDPRNVSENVTGIQGFVGIHGVWTPETEMRYADYGVDALGPLSDVQKRNLERLADYQSGDADRIRQHEQRWLSVLADFMARPDIKDIVTNDVKLIQAHMSVFDVSVIQKENVYDANLGDITQLFQEDASRQSISDKLRTAVDSLGIVTDGGRVISPANTQAGTFDEATVRQVEDDIQRESTVGLGLYQRKRRKPITQGEVFHVHSTSYAGSRITGFDEMFKFGMDAFNNNDPEAVERAWKRVTKIAADEIDRVFDEVGGVRTTNNQGIGIFAGWIEPSVDTTVVIPETATIDEVLARAAHVGELFHQSNVFVTQWGKSKNEQVGEKPANGDYTVERGVVVTLDKPMSFEDVKQMQADGNLGATISEDGKTLTAFTVHNEYDGDSTHAERVKGFEDGIKTLVEFLGARGIKAKVKFQNIRFWNLGAEENGSFGIDVREYREVLGDIEARSPTALASAINDRVDNQWSKRVRSYVDDVMQVIHGNPKFKLPEDISFVQTKLLPQMYAGIAENYELLENNATAGPDADPVAIKAYSELKKALLVQHKWLVTRINMVPGAPYNNRMESAKDILLNNRLKLQSDLDISPLHPLSDYMWDGKSLDEEGNPQYLTDSNGTPMRYNDMMRAMFTTISDGLYLNSANEMGADVAFAAYGLFFDNPYAFWAAATEIRARNIAANYGSAVRNPDGSLMQGELFMESWKRVPQKAGLLPIETMGNGIVEIDNLIDKLRVVLAKDHPGYNGTVPIESAVAVTQMAFKSVGANMSGLVSNPLAQRKQQRIKVTDRVNVPAGNIVVLDADGSINADVIRDVIANEPNLDGNIKQEGAIDRLVSAVAGNIQHMNFPSTATPFDIMTQIFVKTNARYYKSNEIPRDELVKFSTTFWATATDRQNELNWLEPIAHMQFQSPIKTTPDGRILVYHTTLAGQHIGETGELLSSDDVQYMTGSGKSGLGGTPNRISYTYNFIYANHIAKMMANMAAMPNIAYPWKKMERALHTVIETAIVDAEPGEFNDHIRDMFAAYVTDNLSMSIGEATDIIKNDGVDTLLRMIDNEAGGDFDVAKINNAKSAGNARNWMELGELHDGLEAYNRIFGTPYAMLTPTALQNIMKSGTATKDVNVVTYEYAIDPNLRTEHVLSEYELRTYSTVNIAPTGRVLDRTGEVIKTIPEGDITRQGLTNGHLLAQKKRNYRSVQPSFVRSVDATPEYMVSAQSVNDDTEPLLSMMLEVHKSPDNYKAFDYVNGQNMLPNEFDDAISNANKNMKEPNWILSAGNGQNTVDNSLVQDTPDLGIADRAKLINSNRAIRIVLDTDGTSVIQTLVKEDNGQIRLMSHIIPTQEFERNARWLADANYPDVLRTYESYNAKATSIHVTDWELIESQELHDLDLMYFAMLLQDHQSPKWADTWNNIFKAAKDTYTRKFASVAGDNIYNLHVAIKNKIIDEVYQSSPTAAAQTAVGNIIQDFVESDTASTESKLGLDNPIVNGIPRYYEIGRNVKSVTFHSYDISTYGSDGVEVVNHKYYMTVKNGSTSFEPQSVIAYELTEPQYNLVKDAIRTSSEFSDMDEVPADVVINGKTMVGNEQVVVNPKNAIQKFEEILEIFSTADPATLDGTIEIDARSPGYIRTTDVVSNVSFEIFNNGGYISNHVLVGMLTEFDVNARVPLIKKRFASSITEQLNYDERLFHLIIGTNGKPSDITPAYLSALRARILLLGSKYQVSAKAEREVYEFIENQLKALNANIPRRAFETVYDFITKYGANKTTKLAQEQNKINRGPNGGVLIWHGTTYGQSIGKGGALLSADDLESQGVIVSGGGGSSDLVSTTWNKQYAFDVARSNFNLTFASKSKDLAVDYFNSVFELVQRINQAARGERDTDPRTTLFMSKLDLNIKGQSVAYTLAFPNVVSSGATSTSEIESAIRKDVLESTSIEDLAAKLYVLVYGQSTYTKIVGKKKIPTNAISSLDVGMDSLPEDNKFRNVKGWDKLQKAITYIENLPTADVILNPPTDPLEYANWVYNNRNLLNFGVATLIANQINANLVSSWKPRLFIDLDVAAFINKLNDLRASMKQGGYLNVRANKELHDLFGIMFKEYGNIEDAVKQDVTSLPMEAWKKKVFGLEDGVRDALKKDQINGASAFHAAQQNLHSNLGTPYFMALNPSGLTQQDTYQMTPVVYEYEVPDDFRPFTYQTGEWEIRTRGTVGMVPTGRIYDIFGNNIAPLLDDSTDISDVLNHPNTFVAQKRRNAVRKMNPKSWVQVQASRKREIGNEVLAQQEIPSVATPKPIVAGKPLASISGRRRSGAVPAPLLGPPKPPASALRPAPNKVYNFLANAWDFMNDIGRMPLSGDMSPLTIQNWLLANPIEDPKLFFAQFGIGVKAASPNMGFHWKGKTITNGKMMGREAFHDLGNDLRKNPYYQYASAAGLRLTTLQVDKVLAELQKTNPSATIMDVNELNLDSDISMSNELTQRGFLVGASNRFFSMSKDYVKFTKFANTCQHLVDIGYVPGTPGWEETIADFAAVYNVMGGDVNLGSTEEEEDRFARLGKRLWFAPRWAASRFMLDPIGYGLMSMTPQGQKILKANRMEGWMSGKSALSPRARGAMLRMLAKTWALWAALQGIYQLYYRGFGYGATESTKGGMRLRVGETIFSPPGGLDKSAALMFSMMDAANAKAYKSPEEKFKAVKDALFAQLLGNVAPGFSMAGEMLFGRDMMGKPASEVYTPLQTFYNTAVRPKVNGLGVDFDIPKLSNFAATRLINLAGQDFLESYKSLQERERPDPGVRATAYGLASTTGLRARYAPKATNWQRQADERAPVPGIKNILIGKDRNNGQ